MSEDIIDIGELTPEELNILSGLREIASEEEKKADQPQKDPKDEFPMDEMLYIYDSLLTQGGHKETRHIGKRVAVTWRTRTTGESNTITRMIDNAGFSTLMAAQNHTNVLNMAYSLVNFCGKDFENAKLTDRKKFLEDLPEPIIIMLSKSLADFDYKVAKATEVGQTNF